MALRDVTLRDGLQLTGKLLPTDRKVRLVRSLLDAGIPELEIGSLARPDLVPPMANTLELISALTDDELDRCWVWVATPRHVEKAIAAGARRFQYCLSVSDAHNNANIGRDTDVAQDQRQDSLADAAEPDHQEPAREIHVDAMLGHYSTTCQELGKRKQKRKCTDFWRHGDPGRGTGQPHERSGPRPRPTRRKRARRALFRSQRLAPVRGESALVAGQCLDAAHPGGQRRIVGFERQEPRLELLRLPPFERAEEQLDSRIDDEVRRGQRLAHQPRRVRQPALDGSRLGFHLRQKNP